MMHYIPMFLPRGNVDVASLFLSVSGPVQKFYMSPKYGRVFTAKSFFAISIFSC